MSLCANCHAGCCRSFAVPLTGADILRIERDLHLDFWQFACRWADPEGKIARNYAPRFYFSDEPQTPFTICLMHEQSHFLKNTTKCRFLMETPPDDEHPLGIARCGIYGQRPSACRAFPTKLNHTGELAVIHEVPPRGRPGETAAYELCPRPWEPADLDPLGTVQDLVVAKHEMTFFHQIALLWNRNPRAWTIFPEFLRLVYQNRILREEADASQNAFSEERAAEETRRTLPFPAPESHVSTKAA